MKLFVSIVLCICIVQICFVTSTEITEEQKNKVRNGIRDAINGASERFIEDILIIAEKYEDTYAVHEMILGELFAMLDKIPKDENTSKFDANGIKKFNEKKWTDAETVVVHLEYLKMLQWALSKRLPTERYMGIMNLYYIIVYPNATTQEIESALGYLYGTVNSTDLKDPLINIPTPNATDCPQAFQRYSYITDSLKSMVDIKPTVLGDVVTIAEKFPCDDHNVQLFLENFVAIIRELRVFRSNESTISACLIKENPEKLKEWEYDVKREGRSSSRTISSFHLERNLEYVEWILSTRLTDKTYRSIINFEKAIINKTSLDDIQKALEYVFIDLPETNCTVEHGNEAK